MTRIIRDSENIYTLLQLNFWSQRKNMTHLKVKCSGTNPPHVCIHMAKKRLSASSLPVPSSWGHLCLKYHLKLSCKGNIQCQVPNFCLLWHCYKHIMTSLISNLWKAEKYQHNHKHSHWAREGRNEIKTTTCLVLGPHYMVGRTPRTESELYFLTDNSKQLALLFPNSIPTAASPVKRTLN